MFQLLSLVLDDHTGLLEADESPSCEKMYRKRKLFHSELVMQKMEHGRSICLATPARQWNFKRVFPWETRMTGL